jgi:RHS repeat-associated protein
LGRPSLNEGQHLSRAAGAILNRSYGWDTVGNLTDRLEVYNPTGNLTLSENFGYDKLNRLDNYQSASPGIPGLSKNVVLVYGPTGNMLYKGDVGTYSYPAAGTSAVRPGAVTAIESAQGANLTYTYDAAGNLTGATGAKYQSLAYTSFNLPDGSNGLLGANSTRYTWQYGPDHERVKEVKVAGGVTRTTWYNHPDNQNGLGFEQEVTGGTTVNRHYVSAQGQAFLVLETNNAAPTAITSRQWWYRDHLGSIATITDANQVVTQRFSYDPFGKRRDMNGTYDAFGALVYDSPTATDRGFTGHEHLDDVGVVHMNGRIYDPHTGRFMQADPFIQDGSNQQNYNRFSYVLNNPLNATDPSGQFIPGIVLAYMAAGTVAARAVGIIDTKTMRGILGIIASIAMAGMDGGMCTAATTPATPFLQAVAGGMVGGAIACGLECAMSGGSLAMMSFGVGEMGLAEGSFKHAVAHGVSGCASTSVSGGKCGHGFASSFFSTSMGDNKTLNDAIGSLASRVVVGGTASVIGGGKFANGAVNASFAYLYNELLHVGTTDDAMRRSGYTETKYADGTYCNIQSGSGACEYPTSGTGSEIGYLLAPLGPSFAARAFSLLRASSMKNSDDLTIHWGTNRSDPNHALRWAEREGLSADKVKDAIRQDLVARDASSAPVGGLGGHNPVSVQGKTVWYSGYKFPDKSINVGSIRTRPP